MVGIFLHRSGLLEQGVDVPEPLAIIDRTTWADDQGSTQNVTLPTSQSGDVLVLGFIHNGGGIISPATGWTSLGNQLNGNARFQDRSYVWYRVADGTEGATVNVDTDQDVAATCYSIRGASGNVEAASASGGDLNGQPPLLTPTWGAKENVWIAMCFWGHGSITVDTFPGSYNNPIEFGQNIANNGSADGAVADRILSAASEQPGQFTMLQNGAPGDDVGWATWTVAIEPA